MRVFLVLATLLAAAQAQFAIGAPAAGATLHAGQNVNVQIIVPIDTVSYMLRSGVVFFIDNCLERICRASGSQPRHWHCRLWIICLPCAISRPG